MIRDLSHSDRPAGLDPQSLGEAAFLLRPGHFAVVDGDTIWALTSTDDPRGARRDMSFSMRFRSIAAPEKPNRRATDAILQAAGINPHWDDAGQKATDLLKTYLDDRALLVEPTGQVDKYGRMLSDMSVVPYSGGEPDISRAISLERLMLEQGVVNPFRREAPPPVRPHVVEVSQGPA